MRFLYSILFIVGLIISGCTPNQNDKTGIVVSIAPLKWLVSSMVDSTVSVTVLVPESMSPETYEPTVAQLEKLSKAELYISIGLLDFETELKSRIATVAPKTEFVDLSENIEVVTGSCSHEHHEGHSHGVDPHTWLSPKLMLKMAHRVAGELRENKLLNKIRYDSIVKVIENTEIQIDSIISNNCKNRSFAIVHPSLTYFAQDFGLTQLALEIEGKEPSARQIRDIVEQMREAGINTIFYSVGTSDAMAKVIANEIGVSLTEFDPLSNRWNEELLKLSKSL